MIHSIYGKGLGAVASALSLAGIVAIAASGPLPATAAEYDLRIRGRAPVGEIPAKTSRGEKDTVGIVGEGTGETEFLAADQMANAVASAMEKGPNGEVALRVLAIPGKGGLQNIRDVLTRPNMDFGIAPVPVLDAAAGMDGFGNLRKRIAYVAPLYFEEVHVIAGSKLFHVEDLDGKEVAIGEEGSSTAIIARRILAALEINVRPSTLSGQAAVDAVKEGRIAGAFVVSGKPVDTIRGLFSRSVTIMSLPMDKVPEGFVPAVVEHDDYPDLIPYGLKVRTYAVQNALFAYNWPLRSPRGRVERTFLSVLLYRLADLQVGGRHGKWREVNVAGTIPGWRRLPAMQAWLDKSHPRTDGPESQAEFQQFLRRTNTEVAGDARDALYKDFLRWRTSPAVADADDTK